MDPMPDPASENEVATVLAVRRAIHELPPPLRDVVTLHELEENSLRETADALQIPFDTAKDRLRRAREKLRARLGSDDRVLANERAHTRRRAAASGAAIVAAVYATLGDQAVAAAASSVAASAATSSVTASATTGATASAADGGVSATGAAITARVVPAWLAIIAGSGLLAGGFAIGRYTAPSAPPSRSPTVEVTSRAEDGEPEPLAPVERAVPTLDDNAREPARLEPTATSGRTSTVGADPAVAPAPVARAPVGVGVGVAARGDAGVHTTAAPTAGDEGKPEHLLIDRARAGLRRGMHDEALVTLMAHARQYPSGDLAEERDALIIEAYLRSGQTALARRRIEQYRADHPAGVLRTRVDALAAELEPK